MFVGGEVALFFSLTHSQGCLTFFVERLRDFFGGCVTFVVESLCNFFGGCVIFFWLRVKRLHDFLYEEVA